MKLLKEILSILFVIGFSISLNSCSEEPIANCTEQADQPIQTTRLSVEEALTYADEMFDLIEGKTRSNSRKIANVSEVYGTSHTRSDESNPLFYLVNYEGNEGFALLGADVRIDPIYAISSKGKLNMEDTVHNVGLSVFLNDIIRNAEYEMQNGIIVNPEIGGKWTYSRAFWQEPLVPDWVAGLVYGAKEFGGPSETWISSEVVCYAKLLYSVECYVDDSYMAWNRTETINYDKTHIYKHLLKNMEQSWKLSGKNYCDFITSSNQLPYRNSNLSLSENPRAIIDILELNYHGTFPWPIEEGMFINIPLDSQPVIVKTAKRECINTKDPATEIAFIIDGAQEFAGIYSYQGKVIKTEKLCYYHCLWGTGDNTDGYYRSFHSPYNSTLISASTPNLGENSKGSLSTPITVYPPIVFFYNQVVGTYNNNNNNNNNNKIKES